MSETVIPKALQEELRTSYMNYAMSVIVSRAIPDVRDGLKPVHRRILYGMYRVGMPFSSRHKKCATVVGEVLGKYHPHGEQAIYDSLVRMAQLFSMRHVLIDGQGNFGSMDGDMAAAMRYTECRLSRISDEMLLSIDKDTVDFRSNFDDTHKEPVVLPAAFPNLLVNGGSGIAVGMATNVPPHNLREVLDATCYYIDHRGEGATLEGVMQYIKGPDFPTGGIIYGKEGILKGYRTGRGIFKVRARLGIEEVRKGQQAVVVTEIPYQVNKSELIKRIAELVKSEVLRGISEVRDESDKDGIRIVIEFRRDVHPQILLNRLYKHTSLEDSFGMNNVVLVDRSPQTLNLLEIIGYYVSHRLTVETRRIRFELDKAAKKAHILEGLIKAVLDINEVIRIIRSSRTVVDAKGSLVERYEFTDVQVNAILEMRLSRLVSLEIERLRKEYEETLRFIEECKEYLTNEGKIYDMIKRDLIEIRNKYGDERKTEIIISALEDRQEEDYIQKANMVVSVTQEGYIKRIDTDTYKVQHRGGVGIKALYKTEADLISLLFVAVTHDIVMFITNMGKAYYLKAYEVPVASRIAKGVHIRMLLNLAPEEEVQGYIAFKDFEQAKTFLMVTAKGLAKKANITDLVNAKKRGVQAIHLREGDVLVAAVEVNEGDDIMIFSKHGISNRTCVNNFRTMGRLARGVRGIRLRENDSVIGVEKVDDKRKILLVSAKGYGKRLDFEGFKSKGRGTMGQICMKVTEKTGNVTAVISSEEEEDVLAITAMGNVIRIESEAISTYSRTAQGLRVVSVNKKGDTVTSLAVIKQLDENENENKNKNENKNENENENKNDSLPQA